MLSVQQSTQATGSSAHTKSMQHLYGNARTQRTLATGASYKYLQHIEQSKDEKLRVGSATSGELRNTVVLFAESQRQQTPGYMQPIQQKFKKQTLEMVREKQVHFTSVASATTMIAPV